MWHIRGEGGLSSTAAERAQVEVKWAMALGQLIAYLSLVTCTQKTR